MNILDFLIGLTLVNGMPHFVLGVWKVRMLSGFGFSSRANIAYGFLNFGISVGLFLFRHGLEALVANGIYAGGLLAVILYILLARFFYVRFHRDYIDRL